MEAKYTVITPKIIKFILSLGRLCLLPGFESNLQTVLSSIKAQS